ncbi:MAG: hypothetical protein AAF721_19660 [Myxococcota bacterium]
MPLSLGYDAQAAPSKGSDGDGAVRFTRKAGKVRTRGLPKAPKKSTKPAKDPEPGITGREWERKQVATSVAVNDELIATAKRLMAAVEPTDKQYPDYAFRLANLYLDKRQVFEMQAGKLYEVIHDLEKKGKKSEAAQAKAKQKRLLKRSREAGVNAVRTFHDLVNDKRLAGYKRMDESLYYYATELGNLGKSAEMQKAYVRLLRDFPTSPYRPQVYLSFADHKYNAGEIADALRLYQQIVDGFEDSPVYAYALYKIGWCHLNPVGTAPADYAKSLNSFVAAIKATKEGKAGSEANGRQLRREARRDLVKAYVHSSRPSAAWGFFAKVGNGPKPKENMQRKMMELLADAYYGEGDYVESSAIYKVLQRELPDDAQTCSWQARVVENALATDDKRIQWKETKDLTARWESFKSSDHKKIAKKKCRSDAVDALVQRATTWHDEANKTKQDEAYELAGYAYAEFLDKFPKHKDAYEMNFYLAEVKWAQAERLTESNSRKDKEAGRAMFCESAEAFIETLEAKPTGKLTREAAYAQMLAWKNCTNYDEIGAKGLACEPQSDGTCVYRERHNRRVAAGEDAKVDASSRFPVTEYSEAEQHMLDAYARYQKYVRDKKDPELPKILFHRGKLMVEHHRFDEAVPVLETLVDKFDGTRYSAWAAEMLHDVMKIRWADSANSPKQKIAASKRLLALTDKLQKKKLWKHGESDRLRKAVPDTVMAVRWTIAQGECDAGAAGQREAFVRCGNAFHEIYEEFPSHDRGDELLYNAAIAFEAGYLVGNAIQLRKALIDRHPDSALYKKTLREVAENYQAIAYYEQSAERLEAYAEKFKRDEYAGTALSNAYLFRAGLGDEDKARQDLEKYEALYRRKNPGKAAEVYWSQTDLLDAGEQIKHAEEYIRRYGKKGGTDRLVVAHAKAGQLQWRKSCSKKMLADACVTLKRKKAMAGGKIRDDADGYRRAASKKVARRCGSATSGILVVHDRDKGLAAKAGKHFDQAIALATKGVTIPKDAVAGRAEAFRDAWAMSVVYKADADYEAYLRIEMPEGLDFFVEPWKKDSGVRKWEREYDAQVKRSDESKARFSEFMTSKKKLGESLLATYAKVAKIRSPYWVLAGAARSAVVWQNFADQLHRAEVPAHLRTQEEYDSYCFTLSDYAQPLEKMAMSAFEYCLGKSTEYQYFNDFSRMCEEELQQRDADRFPATNEIFGRSTYTDARMDVVGVQIDLHGDKRLADTQRGKTR